MIDVIVVGARCAGAAAAIRFARSGYSVLVVDKSKRGSDTLSTHVLVPGAIRHLDHLGLLDEILAIGAPPVRTILVEFDGESHPNPLTDAPGFALSVRRTVLDPLLVRAAERAGVNFRFGVRVEDLIWENGRVVGISGKQHNQPFEARARLVVGADGRHSIVARKTATAEYNSVPSLGAAVYAYFQGVGSTVAGTDVLHFASGPGCDILCCPCDGDLHIILLILDPEEFNRINNQTSYEARLQTVPTLAPRLRSATCVSRLFRAPVREIRGYFRKPYGPGWALIGDAGYYAHPAAANGIRDALRSADLLHEQVTRAWIEGYPAESYLDHFQSMRDDENRESYYESYRQGSVNPFRDPTLAAEVRGN
jgi:2-polyprenyl-6-methoxyphenol hydroxylase-like FAD-dependent oxidoreductase